MRFSEAGLGVAPQVLLIGSAGLRSGEWDCRLHAPFWRMYHHIDGGIALSGIRGLNTIPADRIALIPPFTKAIGRCIYPCDQVFVHVAVVGLPGGWSTRAFPGPIIFPPLYEPLSRAVLHLLHHRDFAAAPMTSEESLWIHAVFCRALAEAIAGLAEPLRAELSATWAQRNQVAPALALIEEDLAAPVNVREMAQRCRLSRDHFSKVFRQKVGCPPARWQLERRMAVAAQRLVSTLDPIEGIAEALGFANRFHFSRAFARVHGEPPATYRRRRQWRTNP